MQTGPESIIFTVLVLVFSVVIHEVAHGYAANALGDPTAKLARRLTLNPLRHIDPIGSVLIPGLLVLMNAGLLFGWAKPVPYNPFNLRNQRWGEAFVAIAGIATNFALAILFGLVARYAYGTGSFAFGDLASVVTIVNLSLAFFNLIPIPPFDGYTFLRGILPPKRAMAFRDFENRMRAGGFLTLIVFFFVFAYFLAKPFSALIISIYRLLVGV